MNDSYLDAGDVLLTKKVEGHTEGTFTKKNLWSNLARLYHHDQHEQKWTFELQRVSPNNKLFMSSFEPKTFRSREKEISSPLDFWGEWVVKEIPKKRCWKRTKSIQFVLKVRHVKKSTFESGIIFICGFFCFASGRVSLRKFQKTNLVFPRSKKATQVSATSLLPDSKKRCVSWKRNFLLLLVFFWRTCVEQSVACLCFGHFLRNQPVGFVKGFLLIFQNGWETKPVRYMHIYRTIRS